METIERRYERAKAELRERLVPGLALVSACAAAAEAIHRHRGDVLWAGFYLVDPGRPDELVLGPSQGPPACARIPFRCGICGRAAREGRTIVAPDVRLVPDHIACDPRSRSEIVVPVRSPGGRLLGVLDVDSEDLSAFGDIDARVLEEIAAMVGRTQAPEDE